MLVEIVVAVRNAIAMMMWTAVTSVEGLNITMAMMMAVPVALSNVVAIVHSLVHGVERSPAVARQW